MNLLDQIPNLWPAIVRTTIQGSIALIAVFLACRLVPRLPAWTKSWLWRLAWLRVVFAFISASSISLPLLPAPGPTPIYRSISVPAATQAEIPPLPSASTQPAPPTIPNFSRTNFLTASWLVGVALMLVRLAYHYRSVRRLRRTAAICEQTNLVAQLNASATALNIRPPALLVSASTTKPLLTGVWKPAIILPPDVLLLAGTNIQLILKHELAHLKRRDLAWNALGAIAHILLWFNPLTWLCERESHFTQEAACDEMALRDQTERTPEFAGLLVDIAAKRERAPQLLTVSMIRTANTLERRLKAMKTIHHKGARSLITTIAVAAALTPALIPWRAIAQKAGAVPGETPLVSEPAGDGHRDEVAGGNNFNGNTAEEEKLLNLEIAVAKKDLDGVSRTKENGKASPEEVIAKKREVQKLERELAGLRNDSTKIRESLKEEIADVEKLQSWAIKRMEVGVGSPDDKSKIDRELLRLKRELAALDRGQPALPAGGMAAGDMSMMYYTSNPELMKRYFPQMYAMMTNKGIKLGTNVNPVLAQTNTTAQDTFQSRLNQAYRDGSRPRIRLQPRRPGVVTFVNVKPGEHVEEGHVLIRLDTREASIRLRAAQSEYDIAQAEHAIKKKEASNTLNFMLKQIANASDEYKKSNQEDYDLKVKKLDSELRLAFIKVEQAELALQELTINAPVAGIVGSIVPLPGQSLTESSVAVEFLADPPK